MAATATSAVATQEIFSHAHLDGESEIWDVPAGTVQRTLVKDGARFGVTLTRAPGGAAAYDEIDLNGVLKISQKKQPGVSNEKATAVGAYPVGVTTHGTWEFEGVAGATASTVQGAPVYVTSEGALTTTSSGNTQVGVVNYPGTYEKAAGVLPVKIGA